MSRTFVFQQRAIVALADRCYRRVSELRIRRMKPNPPRLRLDTYPHRTEISLRFSDIDPQWHLNNVRVGEYYQEGRVAFFRHLHRDYGYQRTPGSRTLVVHQAFDYLAEVTYPGTMTIGAGITRVGNSSWTFGLGAFKDGVCVGLSKSVLVYALEAGAAPIPQDYRDLLERFLLPLDCRE